MPKIVEYTAPTTNLTESTRGTQAWEQAGRRLGPLYNEAATFEKQQGADLAQEIKDQEWPFDIAKLLAEQNKGGFHIGGRGIGEDASAIGGNTRIGLPDNSGQAILDGVHATAQISRGMGALGRALNDGGYRLASNAPVVQTEEGGNLVAAAQDDAYIAKYNINGPNDATVNQWTNDAIAAQQGGGAPGPAVDYGGEGVTQAYPGYGNYGPDNQTSTDSGNNYFAGLFSSNASYSPDTGGGTTGGDAGTGSDAGAAAMTEAQGAQ